MNVILNLNLIRRSRAFSKICFYAFLIFITLGLVLLFYPITQIPFIDLLIAVFLLLIGYAFLRINMRMSNRWEGTPRIDEKLTDALKGLSSDYYLCHYITYNAHVLVGTSRIWLLDTTEFSGEIYFDDEKNRWAQKHTGTAIERFLKAEKFPAISKLKMQATKDWVKTIEVIKKQYGTSTTDNLPDPEYRMVFLNEKASFPQADAFSNYSRLDNLKDLIRKQTGTSSKPNNAIRQLIEIFSGSA